ncbi:alpha/beta fold hydrolase [Agrobacterium vitis]|uniref:Alpha/beta fold hydrolase n=1 Tax=Agrobacterium vitis TaxID=373 RepID=A0A7K1RC43_AGRVI|nr:alpha/beta hydrolase [Agrobacterium vitis]MVA55397.1 alpha/beta fold hydrolase [Agrobacterium vitis]
MKHVAVTDTGARIGYVELAGREPVRIFIHGLGSSSLAYFTASAADPLLVGQRSLLIDLLGFGISDRPQDYDYTIDRQAQSLARLLDDLGLSNVDIVAHSMGGSIAVALASSRPDLVGSLVLCEPSLTPTPRLRAEAYTEHAFIEQGFANALTSVGDVWPATMRNADPVAMYRSEHSLGKNMPDDLCERLLGLTMPRLIIVGAKTPNPHCQDQIRAASLPVVTIPEAGHNMMLDNHAAFVAALRDFFLKTS